MVAEPKDIKTVFQTRGSRQFVLERTAQNMHGNAGHIRIEADHAQRLGMEPVDGRQHIVWDVDEDPVHAAVN